MIIGIDASRANKKKKTGTEWYSYYLIKYLAKIDKKNEYILYTNSPLRGGLADLRTDNASIDDHGQKTKFRKGFQVVKSPYNNFKVEILNWPFSYFWTLGRLSLEMIIKKPDVLFVPAHGLPLIRPKNTINTMHDVAFEVENRVFDKETIGPEMKWGRKIIDIIVKAVTFGKYGANSLDYLKWSARHSLKNSKKIIAVSESTKNEIERIYDYKKDNIRVIYNGYNKDLYKKINDQEKIKEVLKKYGISGKYILYVGRLEKKKNTPLLIESFAKTKHYNRDIKEKLVLIGDASFGYDEVKYAITEYHLDNDVIMPGWVEEKDMPYIFSGATAFVFPTLHEGFGIPILQAFGCGVPTLASNLNVIKEIGGDACMYFDCRSKESIGKAIEKIITDDNLRQDLVKKGLKRAENFGWEKCARETLEVINSLKDED